MQIRDNGPVRGSLPGRSCRHMRTGSLAQPSCWQAPSKRTPRLWRRGRGCSASLSKATRPLPKATLSFSSRSRVSFRLLIVYIRASITPRTATVFRWISGNWIIGQSLLERLHLGICHSTLPSGAYKHSEGPLFSIPRITRHSLFSSNIESTDLLSAILIPKPAASLLSCRYSD